MPLCDVPIGDHVEPCNAVDHQAALARRAAGAPAWGQLWRQVLGEDFRDHLDGEPISCGSVLLLQARVFRTDEFGDYALLMPSGVPVHYEIDWAPKRAVVYTDVVGHEFVKTIEPWMRFRWPERRR
jgi:hypothetical protein